MPTRRPSIQHNIAPILTSTPTTSQTRNPYVRSVEDDPEAITHTVGAVQPLGALAEYGEPVY